MTRTCTWCGDPLPEPQHKGHRKQEFCKRPKTCRQQFYLWRKKMKEDAAKLSDPAWRVAYEVLAGHFRALEDLLQKQGNDLTTYQKALEEERKYTNELRERILDHRQHYQQQLEAMRIDYHARLKALGVSEEDLKEFNEYWKKQSNLLFNTDSLD